MRLSIGLPPFVTGRHRLAHAFSIARASEYGIHKKTNKSLDVEEDPKRTIVSIAHGPVSNTAQPSSTSRACRLVVNHNVSVLHPIEARTASMSREFLRKTRALSQLSALFFPTNDGVTAIFTWFPPFPRGLKLVMISECEKPCASPTRTASPVSTPRLSSGASSVTPRHASCSCADAEKNDLWHLRPIRSRLPRPQDSPRPQPFLRPHTRLSRIRDSPSALSPVRCREAVCASGAV